MATSKLDVRRQGTDEIRAKVLGVLHELRVEGLLARANFECCSSCAGYALAIRAERLMDKGTEPKGCCFWHRQDESGWWDSGYLHLRYGGFNTQKYGDFGWDDNRVGVLICEKLAKAGVDFDWNGDPGRTIIVLGAERPY
jgi:hypothetical protein